MADDNDSSIPRRIDVSWIILLVIGILIFISSIITIIVLCLLWRRHRQRRQLNDKKSVLNNKPNVMNTPVPVQINDRQVQSYETQVCFEILF
jgi:heme/copper-type cytochrome/quinol oxidase subunit 2